MAEAADVSAGVRLLQASHRIRPRRPQLKPQDVEEKVPKIIIQRRPPRRPKLPDGSVFTPSTPGSSARPTVQPQTSSIVDHDTVVTSTVPSVSSTRPYFVTNQHIEELNERFLKLDLSQESFEDPSMASCISSTQKRVQDSKRNRRPRGRAIKKSSQIHDESLILENGEVDAHASTSNTSVTNSSEPKEGKKKNHFYLQSLQRDKKPPKSQKDAPEGDASQEDDKKLSNVPPTRKELREKKKKEKKIFNEHLPKEIVTKLLAVQNPDIPNIVVGCIRINPRCYQNAYISLTNGEQDILINGLKDRNRALEGDLVAVVINSKERWFKCSEGTYQRTGSVVCILEKSHPRKAVGTLKKQDVFVFFQPRDSRVPIMKINPRTVPANFYANPEIYEETLFLCDIVGWNNVAFAEGEVQSILGNKGDLRIETNAILFENDLILTPYPDELLTDLPPQDYVPTEADLVDRDDFRKTCVFTIDPATAVDLDDALSCRPLENGNFEIGIHISDVTHFLEAFSPLDRVVAERATTVYMVDNVYHMLPKQLCLVCSLLPGQDKLAFSVMLEVNPMGEILNCRFCKSVINSCCQMSYQQAQIMIDNDEYDWEKDGSLKIHGDYTPADLTKIVKNLYQISRHLNKKRFDEGALKIDQPKLYVTLDENGIPVSYNLEERRESNSLIEEFMLLANMSVAKHLYETMPELSLLRSHAEPSERILKKTQELLLKFGVILDVESAGTLHNSLMNWHQACIDSGPNGTDVSQYRWMVINSLCAKSMVRAVYKCSSGVKIPDELRHYALNTEFYTHFTSPIRRYPDCIVHRLLYASIKNIPLPDEWTSQVCAKVAKNCNVKKHSAKQAQEQSNTLYFTYMLDLKGSMNVMAIVMDVKERSVDTMLCDTGLKVRLYFDDTLEETTHTFKIENEVPSVKLTWKERGIVQEIEIFSILRVKITKHGQLFRLQGIILPPVPWQEL
ncbi:DIS3-like exonuclease 2 [Copidosoma floridanum]|uniref:DIS3-like exonuclease 2 n=1 Tax=Copidosoma floridanum TaxID=29053 RepID=UPI0006C93FC9|nr:DIS3-like exonuclease 2 [Copidosoma floridanum]XP_014219456.1 DIS3-like exonuclease 2 [Copidosoma floridanum]